MQMKDGRDKYVQEKTGDEVWRYQSGTTTF